MSVVSDSEGRQNECSDRVRQRRVMREGDRNECSEWTQRGDRMSVVNDSCRAES